MTLKAKPWIFFTLLALLVAVVLYVGLSRAPSPAPSMPETIDTAVESLHVDVAIRTQPVRFSYPCLVEVRLTNPGFEPVLVNRRLAVGYRDSDGREVFCEVFEPGSSRVVSEAALLYQRDLSSPEEYAWLAPGEAAAASFDLFEWYGLPAAGAYELVVYYQADEPLATPPAGVLTGVYASTPVPLIVVP